jgi:hypothetical protein
MKDKDKRFGVPKIDRLFVPVPHELVLDHRVSSSAHRLWGGLHICAWHKLPPDPDRLAELMHTTRRSVFRWLAELEEYHWMERFRSLDSEERYLLKTSVDEAKDSLTLAKIRAALAIGATLDDIRALLDASTSDKNGTGDKNGTRGDISITGSDKRITPGDRNGTLDANLQLPKAMKYATQNHESHEKSHKTPPTPAHASRNGVGGGPGASITETELYLIESHINPSVARELGDLPLDRVRPLVEQKKAAGSRLGGIVNALRVLRGKLSQPVQSDSADREAAALARMQQIRARVEAIAPPDASELDKQYLMLYLDEEGLTEAEALNKLHAHHDCEEIVQVSEEDHREQGRKRR